MFFPFVFETHGTWHESAQALCKRIGIMVHGQLRALRGPGHASGRAGPGDGAV